MRFLCIPFRTVELESPLPKEAIIGRVRQNTEPWVSPVSKYIGGGGRYIFGDSADAKDFEGDVWEDGFAVQRIQYRKGSRGTRIWSEGSVSGRAGGSVIRITSRTRHGFLFFPVIWALIGLGTCFFIMGIPAEHHPDQPKILLGAAGIFVTGLAMALSGPWIEAWCCTKRFRDMLEAEPARFPGRK